MEENKNLSELSDSILLSVKKLLGITEDDEAFDLDIILNINAASSTLLQLGVINKPYTVTSKNDTYNNLLPEGTEDIINQVKMYFVYKTKLSFDSSTSSSMVIDSLEKMIKEAEWRLMEGSRYKQSLLDWKGVIYIMYKHPIRPDELYHYGIKRRSGRYPWGSGDRPYQDREKEFGVELFKNSEKKNLDKFGSDKNHNILYIDGISGSGKSTLSLFLKEKNDEVIHLDSYFERKNIGEAKINRNSSFNSFLKDNGFDISVLENDELFKNNIMEYFKNVDKFVRLSEEFGRKKFGKGRVIMEGVQVGDGSLYLNKSFYKDKPYIRLTTNSNIAYQRMRERDLNIKKARWIS